MTAGTDDLNWRKATRCANATCVEVAADQGHVYVRDSKNPFSPVLTFGRDEWTAFLAGVKAGEFDDA